MSAKRYRLKLKSLSFVSAVDQPAQPFALAEIIKRDNGSEVTARVQVAKISDEGIVFGFALTSTVNGSPHYDLHGDAIDEAELVKVAAAFLEAGGASDEMHDDTASGSVVFCYPLTTEIADALAIKSDRTGLLVGIRPSPEVLAKFRSGEYTGFSIAGIGEREEITKAATVDAQIAAERERATSQAAEVVKAAADNEQIAQEMLAFVDGIHREHGYDAAREVATRNLTSVAKWGARWIAAHPSSTEVVKRGPESDAQVFKRRAAAIEQATSAYETGRAAFAKRVNKAAAAVTGDFLHTPEGAAVYAAYTKAQEALTEGEPSDRELELEAEIERLTAELAAQAESFGLDHNLEPAAARGRLAEVSPAYKAKYQRMYAATTERGTAKAARKGEAARVYSSGEALIADAERMQAEQARKSMLPLAERKLVEHVETIAKARGIERAAAMAWALDHDPTARTLYQIAAAEQATGRPMPDQVAKALPGAR